MKIALHQITTRNASFEEDLQAYAEAGWTAFEMHLDKAKRYAGDHGQQAYVDLVKSSGLKVVACTGHVVQAFADADTIAANEAAFAETLEYMEAIKCPVVVFGGNGPDELAGAPDQTEAGLSARDTSYREALATFAAQVGKLADMAKPRGVTLALEMNWCSLCRSVATAAEALDLAKRKNVGFLFDAAHFYVSPSRLQDLDRVKGRIVYGHLDDMRGCPPEVVDVNNDRVIPGKGVLPLRKWYQKIDKCGYRGWHAVELFCEDLWQEPVADIARKVRKGCVKVWPKAKF